MGSILLPARVASRLALFPIHPRPRYLPTGEDGWTINRSRTVRHDLARGCGSGKRYLPVSALDATHRTMVVKDLFSSASPTYDRLNHLLSFRRDVAWRRETVKRMRFFSTRAFLDIATGTGDLAIEAAAAAPRRDRYRRGLRRGDAGGRAAEGGGASVWTAVSAWSGAMRCRCPLARRPST